MDRGALWAIVHGLEKSPEHTPMHSGSPQEWEMGGRFKREGIYVYLWLIHVEVS